MKRLITSMACLLATLCMAQQEYIPDMKFRRLDSRDGLSNSQVNCALKDSRGYMWFGTPYGLNRYDGYRMKTYYSDPRDTLTLRNNYIDELYEDADGKLWLKQGMSYTIYDPKTERFDRHPEVWLSERGVQGGIERVFIDSQKRIWVKAYETGVYCYDPQSKKMQHFKVGYQSDEVPKETTISAFSEHGRLVYALTVDGELMAFNGSTGQVEWRNAHIRNQRNGEYADYRFYASPEGDLWVLAATNAYIYLSSRNTWFNSVAELMQHYGVEGCPENLQVWDAMTDREGRIWLATDHYGIFVIDMKHKVMRQFINDKNDASSISDITLKKFYQDPEGRVWICSYKNGVNLYVESLSNFKNLELGDINTITEDKLGRFWLGTNSDGIIVYDPNTNEQQTLNKSNSGFRSDVMVASWTARDGSLWFGTFEGGLMRYRDGEWKIWTSGNDLSSLQVNNVWDIIDDKEGNLWIGTLGGGVQRLALDADTFSTYRISNSSINSDYIASMDRTNEGMILVGTSNFYSLIDPRSRLIANFDIPQGDNLTLSPSSTQVVSDSRGLIWQGSSAGICIYDPTSGQVSLLDMHSGMIGSSVVAVVEDLRHTMWVVTDHGVSNIIPEKQEDGTWSYAVRSFNSSDGLQQGPYNQRAVFCTRDGRILIGGQGGLDIINPEKLGSSQRREKPLFSGLVVNNNQIMVGKAYDGHVILDEALDDGAKLVLRYSENQFSIQMASNAGVINNQSRFVYKLDGFNERWAKTDPQNPNISFMSLPPGSYTLCVMMLYDDGTLRAEESRLHIVILSPWYRSWWAWLIYTAIAAFLLWLVWRWLMRREQRRIKLERFWMTHMHQDKLPVPVDGEVAENEELAEVESLDDRFIVLATRFVEDSLDEGGLTVKELANLMGLSRMELYRRMVNAAGITPKAFIRQIRLRQADMKEKSTKNKICTTEKFV